MSSDIQGLLITIHWHGGDPFLCDPLFFNVSLWQCLANASQA
jgi:sulfatase maturation enzyme AslB (radical SAM superfamily)